MKMVDIRKWHTFVINISDEKLSKPLDKALHISWGISHATYSAAVFITALYWSLLYKDDAFSYLNLYVHGLQVVEWVELQFIEFLFSLPNH